VLYFFDTVDSGPAIQLARVSIAGVDAQHEDVARCHNKVNFEILLAHSGAIIAFTILNFDPLWVLLRAGEYTARWVVLPNAHIIG